LLDFGRLEFDGRRPPAGLTVRLARHAVLKASSTLSLNQSPQRVPGDGIIRRGGSGNIRNKP
jgi:hypothetical protein